MISNDNVVEIMDSNFVSYLIKDNQLFSQTAYKVLQSQEKNGFIKCAKILHNGNVKLIYLASHYKSLQSLLSSLVPDVFLLIVSNLLKTIIDVKSNGFLQCENIDLSFDKIFIDCNNYKVKLIYLPINADSSYKTQAIFENQFKSNMSEAINHYPNIVNPATMRLGNEINSNALTLDNIYQQIKNQGQQNINVEIKDNPCSETKNYKAQLALKSLDGSSTLIQITKAEFIIGKNPELVDGVIANNNAISRVHCKIIISDKEYGIVDMTSANGTYVNDKKVPPSQKMQMKIGDTIKIANAHFVLVDLNDGRA